jgi:DNA-binding GntR family transcriptional regulator
MSSDAHARAISNIMEPSSAQTPRAPASKHVAEIVACLEEEIAIGVIRPRERLIEDGLANRFGTKRHFIRQALVELETMGIAVRQPNKGAVVRDLSIKEVEGIYLVRELVERRATELMPLPGHADLIANLKRIHRDHLAATERGDLRRVFRLNLLFHRTFFAACEVPPLVEVIEQFALRAHAVRSYTIGDPDVLARFCQEHAAMIELLIRGDREALVALVNAHIQPAKLAYLKAVSRISLAQSQPAMKVVG